MFIFPKFCRKKRLPAALPLALVIAMPLAAAAFFDSSYTAPGVNYTVRDGTAYIGYNSGRGDAVQSTSLGKNVGSFLGGPLGAIFKKENGREMAEGDVVTISEGEFLGWMEATGSAVFVDPLFKGADAVAMADNFTKYLREYFSKNPSENGKTILQYYSDTPESFADLEKAFKNSGGKAEITADIKKLNDFIKSASPSAAVAPAEDEPKFHSKEYYMKMGYHEEMAAELAAKNAAAAVDYDAIAKKYGADAAEVVRNAVEEDGCGINEDGFITYNGAPSTSYNNAFTAAARAQSGSADAAAAPGSFEDSRKEYIAGQISKEEYIARVEVERGVRYDKKYNNFKINGTVNTVDILATEVLTGHIVFSDDSSACAVFNDPSMDPYAPRGIDGSGTGLL